MKTPTPSLFSNALIIVVQIMRGVLDEHLHPHFFTNKHLGFSNFSAAVTDKTDVNDLTQLDRFWDLQNYFLL